MERSPGWSKLVQPAFEMAALALGGFAMDLARGNRLRTGRAQDAAMESSTPITSVETKREAAPAPESGEPWTLRPIEFLTEVHDEGAHLYHATDTSNELVAALYSDGRIRVADTNGRRFAGALIAGHADLLELRENDWSEVFLRVTPTGRMQLEFRAGPYDGSVFTCEALRP